MRARLDDDDYMLDERPAHGPGARGKRAKPYNTVKRQLEKLTQVCQGGDVASDDNVLERMVRALAGSRASAQPTQPEVVSTEPSPIAATIAAKRLVGMPPTPGFDEGSGVDQSMSDAASDHSRLTLSLQELKDAKRDLEMQRKETEQAKMTVLAEQQKAAAIEKSLQEAKQQAALLQMEKVHFEKQIAKLEDQLNKSVIKQSEEYDRGLTKGAQLAAGRNEADTPLRSLRR